MTSALRRRDGHRDTQLRQTAEAPLEGCLGEESPGRGEEPRGASKGPARLQSAAVADHRSDAVELAARHVRKREPLSDSAKRERHVRLRTKFDGRNGVTIHSFIH